MVKAVQGGQQEVIHPALKQFDMLSDDFHGPELLALPEQVN